MTRTAPRLALLLAIAWLTSLPASAQWVDVSHQAREERSTEVLRLSLGAGFSMVAATETETNGRRTSGDTPEWFPMPALVARVDYPVHALVLLGVQGSLFYWQDSSGKLFGDSGHTVIDTSVVGRLRFGFGTRSRHEIVLSAPFGPTFDVFDASPRSYGGSLDNEVGWHTGLFVGYQMMRKTSLWGWFGEIGFTWHHIPKTYTYQLEGARSATEEMLYQPLSLFIRAGGMLLPFR
jgi:hypothetical protein